MVSRFPPPGASRSRASGSNQSKTSPRYGDAIAGPEVPRDQWKAFYLKSIADLKPGLTELIVHLGHDDSELQAVTVDHEPYGSAWRQRDYDVMNSAEFKQAPQE